MRESFLEDYLVARVVEQKGEVRKLQWIGRRGAPDRFVLLPWRIVFVELKRPGKKLEPHQHREHERLRRFGLDVIKIDTLEQIDELVRRN